MFRLARLAVPVVAAVVSGCDHVLPSACTTEARAAINVVVRDSITGAPAASNAIIVARDGAFTDTLTAFDGLNAGGAWERPGTYAVTITKSGYREWSVTGVRVVDGGCHVQSVILQARLQPT